MRAQECAPSALAACAAEPRLLSRAPSELRAARRAAEERLRRARPAWGEASVRRAADASVAADPALLLVGAGAAGRQQAQGRGGAAGSGAGLVVAVVHGEARVAVARAGGVVAAFLSER